MDNKKDELERILVNEKNRLSNAKIAHIVYNNGKVLDGRVIATFDSEDTNYQYFLFTDENKTQDGLYVVYAARYDVINSVLQKTGFELADKMVEAEIRMIQDVLDKNFSKGAIFKKPTCYLQLNGIRSVSFD